MADSFPLDLPEVAIDIEDAGAKEILQYGDEARAFGVVAVVGFEYVLHDGGIGRDDAAVARAAEDDRVGWGGSKDASDPVMEVVTVL